MSNITCSIGHFSMGSKKKIPARCNRWDCKDCGKIKKNKLLDRVKKGFNGKRIRRIVLSVSDKTFVCDDHKIKKYWQQLRTWLAKLRWYNKKTGELLLDEKLIKDMRSRNPEIRNKAIQIVSKEYEQRRYTQLLYFWTMEFTVKGLRHMHVLINVYIPQKVLQYAWWRVTGMDTYYKVEQVHMDIRGTEENPINNPAGYMAKYLTKAVTDKRIEGKERRYGFSRSYRFKSEKFYYSDEFVYMYNPFINIPNKKKKNGEPYKPYGQIILRYKDRWVFELNSNIKVEKPKEVKARKIMIDTDCMYWSLDKQLCTCGYSCKNMPCRRACIELYKIQEEEVLRKKNRKHKNINIDSLQSKLGESYI